MYRARSVGFLRLILEKYQPTAQPLIPIDSKLQIAYYTVLTHNKHTRNKHICENKQILLALTKMCLF